MNFIDLFKNYLDPFGDAGNVLSIVLKFLIYGVLLAIAITTCYHIWKNFASLQNQDIDEGQKKVIKKNLVMSVVGLFGSITTPFLVVTLMALINSSLTNQADAGGDGGGTTTPAPASSSLFILNGLKQIPNLNLNFGIII